MPYQRAEGPIIDWFQNSVREYRTKTKAVNDWKPPKHCGKMIAHLGQNFWILYGWNRHFPNNVRLTQIYSECSFNGRKWHILEQLIEINIALVLETVGYFKGFEIISYRFMKRFLSKSVIKWELVILNVLGKNLARPWMRK